MKKQFLLILGLIFTTTIFAAPVTKESAKKNVLSFLQSKKGNRMYAAPGMKQTQLTQVNYQAADDAFYVFNIGDNEGFVITATDDRVDPILGYSNTGSFNPESLPENMINWLNFYSKQINTVKKLNLQTVNPAYSTGEKTPYRHSIPAMLTTKWNQTSPYNDMTPDYHDGKGHRYTGCVATAMAQVMNYYEWPKAETEAIPAYTFEDRTDMNGNGAIRNVPALDPTVFNWDILSDVYNYNSTPESKQEVAKLMRYCGQGLKMGYWVAASGAYTFDIPETLRKYFNYDKGVRYLDKDGILTYEWEDIVYSEISEGRPVLYSGASGTGGHQFVCDGYDNGFFHFNWGWGGTSDGYFKLTLLNPVQEGVIGGNGMDFSDSQQMVIGIQPPVEGTVRPEDHVQIGYLQLTRTFDGKFTKSDDGKFSMSLKAVYAVNAEQDIILNVGFGLYDSNNKILEISKALDKHFVTGGLFSDKVLTTSVTVGQSGCLQNDGTYYLRPIYRNSNGEYAVVKNGENNYFKIDVNGKSVKVTTYPVVKVAITDVKLDGPVYTQCVSKISATIENLGEEFNGYVYLLADGKVDSNFREYISIRKGEKLDVTIPFSTYKAKEHTFGISVNGSQNSEEIAVDVIKNESQGADLELTPVVNITSDNNTLDIPVTVLNNAGKPYKAPVVALLFLKSGNYYREVASVNVPVEVAPGEKTEVNVHIDGLDFNKIYHLAFGYYDTGQQKIYGGTYQNGNPKKIFSKYKTGDALSYYDVNGNLFYKMIGEGETYEVPANACFVNVPKNINGRTIVPSSNPNCIYRIMLGVSQAMFSGCNVVNNTNSSIRINLNDKDSYYALEPIEVNEVTLTINVENNMNTLFLPFTPESVTCDSIELSRASSVEDFSSKDYALLPIVAEDQENVYCDFDESFGVAPSVFVVKKELIGKPVVFSAKKLVLDLSKNIVGGKYYNIHASNSVEPFAKPMYGFGIKEFSKNLHSAKPFSIYLTSVLASETEKVNIVYPDGLLETGIEEVDADVEGKMVDVYTLDGVKVRKVQYGEKMLEGLPSGLYIVNGKKFVK